MKVEGWKVPAAALLLIAAAAAFLSWWSVNQRLGKPGIRTVPAGGEGAVEIVFPDAVLDYKGETLPVSEGEREALPPDTAIVKRFYWASDRADVYLIGWLPEGGDSAKEAGMYLGTPGKRGVVLMSVLMGTDRTSIHKPEFCLRGWGLEIVRPELDEVRVKGREPYTLPVMVLRTEKEIDGRVYPGFFVYWFVADGLATARHWERMWWMAKGLFANGELQRWAYVGCLAITLPGQEERCLRRMKRFLAHAAPEFQPRPESLTERMASE